MAHVSKDAGYSESVRVSAPLPSTSSLRLSGTVRTTNSVLLLSQRSNKHIKHISTYFIIPVHNPEFVLSDSSYEPLSHFPHSNI